MPLFIYLQSQSTTLANLQLCPITYTFKLSYIPMTMLSFPSHILNFWASKVSCDFIQLHGVCVFARSFFSLEFMCVGRFGRSLPSTLALQHIEQATNNYLISVLRTFGRRRHPQQLSYKISITLYSMCTLIYLVYILHSSMIVYSIYVHFIGPYTP